ncbi:MAG: DUF1653 domain-containing protein [Bacilli bacterium]|nr:DUF1653 domain-containing protein [Bacilli bacterium]
MEREIKVGEHYKHFKGMEIEIVLIAKDTETLEELIIYHHVGKDEYWARAKSNFLSEVDHEKYPEVKQKYRFERLSD